MQNSRHYSTVKKLALLTLIVSLCCGGLRLESARAQTPAVAPLSDTPDSGQNAEGKVAPDLIGLARSNSQSRSTGS
ncbi:MAG: hypothetical protein M3R15_21140, partial [Acidobacteriota bacterium]|nr:hypothetical protein [Acidobacteriota bacterium]